MNYKQRKQTQNCAIIISTLAGIIAQKDKEIEALEQEIDDVIDETTRHIKYLQEGKREAYDEL
jgi:hypothetical protein